jgi:hypothetical protein
LIDKAAPAARVRQQIGAAREAGSQHETRRAQRPSLNIDQVLDDSFPASDPPSWSGAISRVASASDRDQRDEPLAGRIRADFLEMPGLCLTIEQAQRLWCLERHACEALLQSLIDARFLRRTGRGLFVLCTAGG